MKNIADIFASDGDLSGVLQGFQHRPEQQAMAETIFAAIEKGDDLICEAGTGTGKTMAYLVPALLSEKRKPSFPPAQDIYRINSNKKTYRLSLVYCRKPLPPAY